MRRAWLIVTVAAAVLLPGCTLPEASEPDAPRDGAGEAPGEARGEAHVAGRVVDVTDDAPIPGATVRVERPAHPPTPTHAPRWYAATTDADGRFDAIIRENVTAGERVRVTVSVGGYVPAHAELQAPHYRVIEDAQPDFDVTYQDWADLEVRLTPLATVSGVAPANATVVLVDVAHGENGTRPHPNPLASTRAAADGRFSVPDVRPDRAYALGVASAGRALTVVADVTPAPGEDVRVDPVAEDALAPAPARVHGTVTMGTEDGPPAAGAFVWAIALHHDPGRARGPARVVAATFAGADGTYALALEEAGNVTIRASLTEGGERWEHGVFNPTVVPEHGSITWNVTLRQLGVDTIP